MGKGPGIWGKRCRDIAAPGKFEVKRLGALEHRNNEMVVFPGGYSASNFTGSAIWGRVQGYGADGLRTKVKFFYLTYFTFGFTLPVSTLIL